MAKTPTGTSVGVEDPYAVAGRCDFVTSDGRCRFAVDHAARDPAFARERRCEGFACPVVQNGSAAERGANDNETDGDRFEWRSCPHYRSRTRGRQCRRCGIEERRTSAAGEQPLLEEHHLSYADRSNGESSHEITVSLCRWCHAKVHGSWARIDDAVNPDPAAIAVREGRRSRERAESAFETAAERHTGTDPTE